MTQKRSLEEQDQTVSKVSKVSESQQLKSKEELLIGSPKKSALDSKVQIEPESKSPRIKISAKPIESDQSTSPSKEDENVKKTLSPLKQGATTPKSTIPLVVPSETQSPHDATAKAKPSSPKHTSEPVVQLEPSCPSKKAVSVSTPSTPQKSIGGFSSFSQSSGFAQFSNAPSLFSSTKSTFEFSKLLSQKALDTPSKALASQVRKVNFDDEKPAFEQKEVVTGEENERLVDSARGKLFMWDEEQWRERGVGLMKISEIEKGKSRIVMRCDGVLRLILNVRIQPGMPIHVRNEKYIEFIASENGKLVKFLMKLKNNEVADKLKTSLVSVIPEIKE